VAPLKSYEWLKIARACYGHKIFFKYLKLLIFFKLCVPENPNVWFLKTRMFGPQKPDKRFLKTRMCS
jgi:hypothetical protein